MGPPVAQEGDLEDEDGEESQAVFPQVREEMDAEARNHGQAGREGHDSEGQRPGRFPCPEAGQPADGKEGGHFRGGDAEDHPPEADLGERNAPAFQQGPEEKVDRRVLAETNEQGLDEQQGVDFPVG